MFVLGLLAQAPVAEPPVWVKFVPILVLFGVFYMMLIRPQQKQQRVHETMLKALKKHDDVVTIGGVHGSVLNVKESTVVLRVDDNVKVEVDRTAVARVTKSNEART